VPINNDMLITTTQCSLYYRYTKQQSQLSPNGKFIRKEKCVLFLFVLLV